MGKVYLVTGTDTGVGKTYFTYWSAKILKSSNIKVSCLKPVETGVGDVPQDAKLLAEATDQDIKDVVIYTYKLPLSPYAGFLEEGIEVDIEVIKSKIKEYKENSDIVIVEGAGGICVPIKKGYTYGDLAYEEGLNVIIVGRAGLGTINHTYLTWFYSKERGLDVRGIVLSGFKGEDISEKTNPFIIEEMTGIKPLCIPYGSSIPKELHGDIVSLFLSGSS